MGVVVVTLVAVGAPPEEGVTVTVVSLDFTVPHVTDTTKALVPVRAGVVHVMDVYTPFEMVPATAGDAQAVVPMLIVQPV